MGRIRKQRLAAGAARLGATSQEVSRMSRADILRRHGLTEQGLAKTLSELVTERWAKAAERFRQACMD